MKVNPNYKKIRSSTTSTLSNATTTTASKRCSSKTISSENNRSKQYLNHYPHRHHHHQHVHHHHISSPNADADYQSNETILSNTTSNTKRDSHDDHSLTDSTENKKLCSLVKFYKKLSKKLRKATPLLNDFDEIMNEINRILNNSLYQFKQASKSLDAMDYDNYSVYSNGNAHRRQHTEFVRFYSV